MEVVMNKFKILITLLVLSFMVLGCGGGGGGDSTGVNTNSTTPLNVNQSSDTLLRLFQAGDSWTYTGSGIATNNKNGVKLNMGISGTISISNVADGNPTKNAQFAALNMVLTDANGSSTTTTNNDTVYYTQDNVTRNCNIVAENNGMGTYNTVSNSPILFYGNLYNPASWSVTYNYSNGDVKTKSVTYLGQEIITVPAGTFKTLKFNNIISIKKNDGSNENDNNVEWTTLDGQSIKAEYVSAITSSTQNISMNYNMLLKSSTVSFQAPPKNNNSILSMY